MSRPALLLSNQLCFLVYRLERQIVSRYRPLLANLDLTYPQYLVMLALWERDDRTIGELCRALDLETGTLSPLLKRLERRGLLTRTRSRADERSVRVMLSPRGKALEVRAATVPAALASCLGITVEEREGLFRLIARTLDRLEVAKKVSAGGDFPSSEA